MCGCVCSSVQGLQPGGRAKAPGKGAEVFWVAQSLLEIGSLFFKGAREIWVIAPFSFPP